MPPSKRPVSPSDLISPDASTPEAALEQARRLAPVDAARLLKRALSRWPGDPALRHALGSALLEQGNASAAIVELQRAVEFKPREAGYWTSLGHARRLLSDPERAAEAFRRAIELNADDTEAVQGLAASLQTIGQPAEAARVLERAVARHPTPALRTRLALAASASGRAGAAIAPLRRAIEETEPATYDGVEARTVYATQLTYLADTQADTQSDDDDACDEPVAPPVAPEELRRAHEDWAHAAKGYTSLLGLARGLPPLERRRRTGDRLRVGYVSWDYREHSCAYFMEPLLRAHDRDRVEVTCYATGPSRDQVSARFRSIADCWRDTPLPPDRTGKSIAAYRAFLERVRADGIDVLIETGGHTVGSCLAALAAARAAPTQVTYLGYAATTGLDSIDLRLTDADCDTPEADAWHTETLARLDRCFLCYQPPAYAPEAAPTPAESSGVVTFGSFNRAAKLTDRTVSLWARALAPIAHARLLLKGASYAEEAVRRSLLARFEAAGLAPERIEFAGRVPSGEAHLAEYRRVDVSLDTLPYNGTTTTCESLWMGVPTLTRVGGVHAARVSGSILRTLGLPELAPTTDAGFIAEARALAEDVDRLRTLRSTMRERMAGSALMDAEGLARAVEHAIESGCSASRRAA